MTYLFDASAILTAVRLGLGERLEGNYTLRLARYEIGNAILVEGVVRKTYTKAQQLEFLGILDEWLGEMSILDIEGIAKNILDVAVTFGLSFYDASYVYCAKYTGITLVTEDKKMVNKIGSYIKTVRTSEIQ
ncbi:MAG: type II toxin-antitoxin system VapC family toxin [Candidatus Micrarchaeales archaeon]